MVMPSPAVSMATARIMPSMAAFAAPYAAEPGLLTSGPVTEVTFTMRPYFWWVMAGRTARGVRKGGWRVVAIWVLHSAREVCRGGLLLGGWPGWARPGGFPRLRLRPGRGGAAWPQTCPRGW